MLLKVSLFVFVASLLIDFVSSPLTNIRSSVVMLMVLKQDSFISTLVSFKIHGDIC